MNTIAKLSFMDRENPLKGVSKKESIKNIGVMREHHYKFGENALNYETSSKRIEHNNRLVEPDRSPVRTLADAKKELDGHHFDFGHESPAKVTTHQHVFEKKVSAEIRFHQIQGANCLAMSKQRPGLMETNINEGA